MELPLALLTKSSLGIIQGMAIGALVTVLVGFSWGGWVTGGVAQKNAQLRARNAAVAVLAPICAENFRKSANANERLIELNKFTLVWDRGAFVEKGGWAAMPGTSPPEADIAQACARILGNLETADFK